MKGKHFVAKVVIVAALLCAVGGGAAYAFTASNSVSASLAGVGVGTVNGYAISNITYPNPALVNGTDYITTVNFVTNAYAGSASVGLYGSGSLLGQGTCTSGTGYIWTCSVSPHVSELTFTSLQVSAAG